MTGTQGRADTPREYEILVAGPIGPAATADLPGFTSVSTPTSTLLTGTAADPDDLRAVLRLLRNHGLTATLLCIDPHTSVSTDRPTR